MGIFEDYGVAVMKSFPLGPWLVIAAFAVTSIILANFIWRGRGPSAWYDESRRDASGRRLFFKGSLPLALFWSGCALVVLLRYLEISVFVTWVKNVAIVFEWILGGIIGLATIGMLSTFYFDYPRWLIAPPYRKERPKK